MTFRACLRSRTSCGNLLCVFRSSSGSVFPLCRVWDRGTYCWGQELEIEGSNFRTLGLAWLGRFEGYVEGMNIIVNTSCDCGRAYRPSGGEGGGRSA